MSGESALDWTTRVRLLLGAARGLACIHREYRTSGVPHGNVKSTNVLLDKDGAARVADFGLALLLSPAHAIARLGGYTAPEQQDDKRLSQEADVYSFGVLVLEALTGKAPAQHPQPDARKKGAAATSLSLPGDRRSASSPHGGRGLQLASRYYYLSQVASQVSTPAAGQGANSPYARFPVLPFAVSLARAPSSSLRPPSAPSHVPPSSSR